MPAFFQNGVLNEGNTPAARTGTLAVRPAATAVSEGTIYIAYDTQEIYTSQGGNWVKVSGGGGGSQNLDQVLAVGNTANGKQLWLNGINNTTYFRLNSSIGSYLVSDDQIQFSTQQNTRTKLFQYGVPTSTNSQFLRVKTTFPSGQIGNNYGLEYENDINGKNIFFIEAASNFFFGEYRRFVVNASYTGGNTAELIEENTGADTLASVQILAENQTARIWLKSTPFLSLNVYDQLFLRSTDFSFINTSGNAIQINPSFPLVGTITVNLPEFDGKIANVNERIIDNNVDLSAGSYPCAAYGVYVVNVGDNTNTFDLDTFVSNGVDGQFVTICAGDVPVKCTNTAGNIIGTANINSKGLYKLMKIGNNIYSSHI